MNWNTIALVALILAAIPAGLFVVNLMFYQRIKPLGVPLPFTAGVSVLIPARNEEANIEATVRAALENREGQLEVVVLDDHSTDRTAEIVARLAAVDSRVRLETAPPLPAGWCGKQHACQILARRARFSQLVFIDADVRLAPDALGRMIRFLNRSGAALISGVPRQELVTFSERLLLPQIHFVLLGFLPLPMMRWTNRPAFSAGCGQLFVIRREAYESVGGHESVRATLHDGVKLPRLFRRHGFKTALFDATDVASCRMYRTNGEVWRGLGKNATEGLAAPAAILPMSALLFGGQVLPFMLMAALPLMSFSGAIATGAAVGLAWLPRGIAVMRFRQPIGSALLHPIGVLALLLIQWIALVRQLAGRPAVWKGRSYSAAPKPV